MKANLHLLSTWLDHLAKKSLKVTVGTFTVLHVLKLLSKRQAVREAWKYYEPHFVDEEIKETSSLHAETKSELGLPFPFSSPMCSILLASTRLSNCNCSQHTQQLPSSLQTNFRKSVPSLNHSLQQLIQIKYCN